MYVAILRNEIFINIDNTKVIRCVNCTISKKLSDHISKFTIHHFTFLMFKKKNRIHFWNVSYLSFGRRKKSQRTKPGEYGACDKTVTFSDFTSSIDVIEFNLKVHKHASTLAQGRPCTSIPRQEKTTWYMQSRKLPCDNGSFGNYRLSTVFICLILFPTFLTGFKIVNQLHCLQIAKCWETLAVFHSYPFLVICHYTQISYVKNISYLQNTLHNEMHQW